MRALNSWNDKRMVIAGRKRSKLNSSSVFYPEFGWRKMMDPFKGRIKADGVFKFDTRMGFNLLWERKRSR